MPRPKCRSYGGEPGTNACTAELASGKDIASDEGRNEHSGQRMAQVSNRQGDLSKGRDGRQGRRSKGFK